MSPDFRKIVIDGDEVALERTYFDNKSSHLFAVDWGEDDADIVAYCAEALGLESSTAEWREEDLFIILNEQQMQVPLQLDVADRHITVCTLNDVLRPNYEVRFLVASFGGDTLGFAALTATDWTELEEANGAFVAENFIDPRKLPNLMTELTQQTLPPNAKARFERMLSRNQTR
jgi:hypothetical protein